MKVILALLATATVAATSSERPSTKPVKFSTRAAPSGLLGDDLADERFNPSDDDASTMFKASSRFKLADTKEMNTAKKREMWTKECHEEACAKIANPERECCETDCVDHHMREPHVEFDPRLAATDCMLKNALKNTQNQLDVHNKIADACRKDFCPSQISSKTTTRIEACVPLCVSWMERKPREPFNLREAERDDRARKDQEKSTAISESCVDICDVQAPSPPFERHENCLKMCEDFGFKGFSLDDFDYDATCQLEEEMKWKGSLNKFSIALRILYGSASLVSFLLFLRRWFMLETVTGSKDEVAWDNLFACITYFVLALMCFGLFVWETIWPSTMMKL